MLTHIADVLTVVSVCTLAAELHALALSTGIVRSTISNRTEMTWQAS